MANREIEVTDEFTDPVGDFDNYDTGPIDQRGQLHHQKHTNIRSMIGDTTTFEDIGRFINMLVMDSMSMSALGNHQMDIYSVDLSARIAVREGERWSGGFAAKDPARNNWYVLEIPCESATPVNTASSVMFE